MFGIRQAQACLFAGALLAAILLTRFLWPADAPVARYDFLCFFALFIQVVFLWLKLESVEEAKVIFVFHVVGTVMEVFKTAVGSWEYPEESVLRIGGVPLFSGFMYAAIGSYIARVWRIFDFRFTHFPQKHWMALLCVLIYVNFFTHHYLPDIRYLLFGFAAFLFWRTRVYFTPLRTTYWMPLLLGFLLVSMFIWLAENLGTFGNTWVYPSQKAGWHLVPLSKWGSWYLLMLISFVLVSFLHKETPPGPHQK